MATVPEQMLWITLYQKDPSVMIMVTLMLDGYGNFNSKTQKMLITKLILVQIWMGNYILLY